MAIIDLVIKISEEDYKNLQKKWISNMFNNMDLNHYEKLIVHGIPLPKGHGRIGDLDALEEEMTNGIKAGNFEEGYEEYEHINNVDDCLECVKYADTIIEADKTGKQDYENNHNHENDDYYRGAQEER